MNASNGTASQEFGGQWTSEKLDILQRYLDAYTTALKNQPFSLMYIDAFAGTGALLCQVRTARTCGSSFVAPQQLHSTFRASALTA